MRYKMTAKVIETAKLPLIVGQHNYPFSMDGDDRMPVLWVNDFEEESAREFFDLFSSFISDDIVSHIIVYIDSFGGQVDSLAAIAELVVSSPKPIITVAVGKAFSAGAILLTMGEPGYRWIAPNSRIMLHRLQLGCQEGTTVDNISHIAEEILRLNDVWMHKLVDKSKMKWTEFNKKLNEHGGQWFMDAKTAVAYGFADHIGLPKIREVRHWVIDIK